MGVRFSPLLPGVCVFEGSEWRCDAGSFNGRTRVFEARHERSIRSPAARYVFEQSSRSGEGYGYFSFQENTVSDCSLLRVSENGALSCARFSRGRSGRSLAVEPMKKTFARSFNWIGSPAL